MTCACASPTPPSTTPTNTSETLVDSSSRLSQIDATGKHAVSDDATGKHDVSDDATGKHAVSERCLSATSKEAASDKCYK